MIRKVAKPENKHKGIVINLVLIAVVVGLMLGPLFMAKNAEFSGADIRARDAISEIKPGFKPGFKPWFNPIWAPPSGEVETFFFALQAAMGAGFIGYFFGYLRGRARKDVSRERG